MQWTRQEVGCPVEGMSSACPSPAPPPRLLPAGLRHKGGSRQSLLLPLPKGADSRTGSPGGGQSIGAAVLSSDDYASCRRAAVSFPLDTPSRGFLVLEQLVAEGLGLTSHAAQDGSEAAGSAPGAAAIPSGRRGLAPSAARRHSYGSVGLNLSCEGERRRTAQVPASSRQMINQSS